MTTDDLIQIALDLQVEYAGQAEGDIDATKHFVLVAKAVAIGEFIQRVQYKLTGEKG